MFFAHPIPSWALAAILLLAAALAVTAYARGRVPLRRGQRAALTGLRFVALALLVFFLLRPVVPLGPPPGGSGVVALVVDTSRSMGLEEDGVTRLARAQAIVRDQLVPALSGSFSVDVLEAGERVQRADIGALSATARTTDLPAALAATRDRYRNRDLAGIVLISDGGNLVPVDHAASGPGADDPRHHSGRGRHPDSVRPRGAQRDGRPVRDGRQSRGHHRYGCRTWRVRPVAGAAAARAAAFSRCAM